MRRAVRLSLFFFLAAGGIAANGRAEPSPPVLDPTPGRSSAGASSTDPTAACPTGMVFIRGGTARVGRAGDEDALPEATVKVPDYCIDRTEVTVMAYQACVAAGRCAPPETTVFFPGFGPPEPMRSDLSRYCNAEREGGAGHPINCVDHEAATRYCAFRRAHLPSEVEWEYAARGPSAAPFPWGDRAPVAGASDAPLCWDRRVTKQGTCVAGAFESGGTRDGVLDMAGNVWEWTSGKLPGGDVVRGGGWTNFLPRFVRATYRWPLTPSTRLNCVGFRCAAPASPAR